MHVIINGTSSETLQGVQVLSLPPITKPRMRTSVAVIDGRPGDIVTHLGYEAYNRKIRVLLHHDYDIDVISAFFNTSGKIIFSNEPDMEYEFETIDEFSFERAVRYKTADITFHVQPYKLSTTEEPATGDVSTLVDKTPYILRRTPFGTRQKGSIVGGSLVWNQLIENGDFAEGSSKWVTNGGQTSYDANLCSFTIINAVQTNALRQTKGTIEGHVYLASMTITPSKATTAAFYIGNSVVGTKAVTASRTIVSVVHKAANNGTYIYYYINRKTELAVGDTCVFENMQAFDLTLMFGSTIADYIYSVEQATAGAGVALAKAWAGITADYYAYDAGSIKSVAGLTAHKMTGFNQWDEEWELGSFSATTGEKTSSSNYIRSKNYIPVLPQTAYYFKTPFSISSASIYVFYYDGGKGFLEGGRKWSVNQTTPTNARYMMFSFAVSSYGSSSYNNDICINVSSSRNGQYEPYTAHEYPLDSSLTLRGIPKLDGDSIYYDGDVYPPSGEVERRYGVVDLGTLTWAKSGTIYFARLATKENALPNYVLTTAYQSIHSTAVNTTSATNKLTSDKSIIASMGTSVPYIYVRDDSQESEATLKASLDGVSLVYLLSTPTTEQADPYTELQICDPAGTEEWVGANMPVGHDTTYIDPISMAVNNEGNTESAPSITIEGEGMVEVTVDGLNILQIQMPSSGEITIDSRTLDATDGEGELANRSVAGDYSDLRLAPGEHTVTVTGDVTRVTLKNTSRWI